MSLRAEGSSGVSVPQIPMQPGEIGLPAGVKPGGPPTVSGERADFLAPPGSAFLSSLSNAARPVPTPPIGQSTRMHGVAVTFKVGADGVVAFNVCGPLSPKATGGKPVMGTVSTEQDGHGGYRVTIAFTSEPKPTGKQLEDWANPRFQTFEYGGQRLGLSSIDSTGAVTFDCAQRPSVDSSGASTLKITRGGS